MKKSGIFIWVLFLFFACGGKKTDRTGAREQASADGQGDGQIVAVITVGELLKEPEAYVDREIKVEGLVTHVCKHSGQRLHLSSGQGADRIRVEAGGDIKRFERDLEGSEIVATGILRKQVIDEAYIEEMERNGRGPKGMHAEDENEAAEGEGAEPGAGEQAQNMRKMLKEQGTDRIVMYWLEGESFEEKN